MSLLDPDVLDHLPAWGTVIVGAGRWDGWIDQTTIGGAEFVVVRPNPSLEHRTILNAKQVDRIELRGQATA